jgi:hypothetical protein
VLGDLLEKVVRDLAALGRVKVELISLHGIAHWPHTVTVSKMSMLLDIIVLRVML